MKALIRELIETMRSLIRAIFALKDATDKMNESQKNHKEGAAATQTEMAAPNLFSEVKDADADEKPARKQL